MKKICLTILVITLSLCMVSCASSSADAVTQPVKFADLSTIIPDTLLQDGFSTLYEQQTPIQLWDGFAVSGRELAQYILDNAIPVVWGSADICDGGSCSRSICRGDECTYDDGKPGIDPIYINAYYLQMQSSDKIVRLAGEMAHEFFHRTQQFGKVIDTRYEEYLAYYLDAQVTQISRWKFDNCNPLDPTSLENWFTTNNLKGYLAFASYPLSVQQTLVVAAAQ